VSTVAALVLKRRIDAVSHYLPLAAKHADKDPEYVHQLRVSTRRANAALKLFAAVLPKKQRRRVGRQLGKLRRAAGAARDLDVMQSRLLIRECEQPDRKLTRLLEEIWSRRQSAQKRLIAARKQLKQGCFRGDAKKLPGRIRWPGPNAEPTFGETASLALKAALDEFFTASQKDLCEIDNLHNMRIAGKRLRYTLELVSGVYESRLKTELYPLVEEIQNKLGTINDHASASCVFGQWAKDAKRKPSKLLIALAEEERRFVKSSSREFRTWWKADRGDDLRRRFLTLNPIEIVSKSM
jgi:CHAD domain-containing protein